MKKLTAITIATLLSQTAFSVEIRDSIFQSSTKVGDLSSDAGAQVIDASNTTAQKIALQLEDFISGTLGSTVDQSGIVSEKVIELSELSGPAFELTKEGVAMVFKASAKGTDASSQVSEKLLINIQPALDVSSKGADKVLEVLLVDLFSNSVSKISEGVTKGSELSSAASDEIIKATQKVIERFQLQGTIDASSDVSERLMMALEKALSTASDVSTNVFGEQNLEAGAGLSGKGLTLATDATFAVFHFISGASEGISNLFIVNKEAIKRAVERDDQETLDSVREHIRASIKEDIEGGETLNQFLTDEELDFYIRLRLNAMD